jgi:hypothetical protein
LAAPESREEGGERRVRVSRKRGERGKSEGRAWGEREGQEEGR